MGKRNLAIVGTHVDFFADIFDEDVGADPSYVSRCASPQDAATSYFKDIFENSNGHIRSAVVAVWPVTSPVEHRIVFDADAVLTPSMEPDAPASSMSFWMSANETSVPVVQAGLVSSSVNPSRRGCSLPPN